MNPYTIINELGITMQDLISSDHDLYLTIGELFFTKDSNRIEGIHWLLCLRDHLKTKEIWSAL